jgi:hypothetical protein
VIAQSSGAYLGNDRAVQTIELAYQTKVCNNAVAVGVRTTIPPAGITQTESIPDEKDTRRTPMPDGCKNTSNRSGEAVAAQETASILFWVQFSISPPIAS